MTEHSLWRFSRAFHRALNERQTDHLESILDDEIDWAIYGPIDMFAFLGPRHGKRAVIDVVRDVGRCRVRIGVPIADMTAKSGECITIICEHLMIILEDARVSIVIDCNTRMEVNILNILCARRHWHLTERIESIGRTRDSGSNR